MGKLSEFLVRRNCEYTLVVVAPDAGTALQYAYAAPEDVWAESWSETEIDDSATREAEADAEAGIPALGGPPW